MQIENNTAEPPLRLSKISEYFTLVVPRDQHLPGQELYVHDFSQMLQPEPKQIKTMINIDKACQLVTQTAYLVFAAHREKKKLDIECTRDLLVNRLDVDKNGPIGITVLMTYGLTPDDTNKSCRAQVSRLYGFIIPYLAKVNGGQLPPILQHFYENFTLLEKLNISSDYEYIKALQETALFRNHATILRLMNCMLMNLLKKDGEAMENFVKLGQRQKLLIAQYKQFKHNKQNQKASARLVEINNLIKSFFGQNLKSLNNYKCTVWTDSLPNEVKMEIRIKEKPMGFAQLLKSKYSTQVTTSAEYKPCQLAYLVEYNGQRSNLSIRLPTDFKILNENQDLLLYQSNLLTFDYEGIGIEIIESATPSTQNNKNTKQLAFKATEQSINKEAVFTRIINLIDRIMIVYRMIEPHLSHIITRDLEVSEQITKAISHYLRLYEQCSSSVFKDVIKC